MSKLIWITFIVGVLAAQFLGGDRTRIIYLAVVFFVITVFRKPLVIALTHLASQLGLIKETINKMPLTIRLVQAPGPQKAAQPSLLALKESGFMSAGDWDIAEMPQIKVSLMVHSTEGMLGVVESASSIGAQVNLHTLYTDGLTVSFTNSKLPGPKFERPNMKRERMPGASPKTLVTRALAQRPKNSFRLITAEEAPQLYEQLYAEEIAFRKLKGA